MLHNCSKAMYSKENLLSVLGIQWNISYGPNYEDLEMAEASNGKAEKVGWNYAAFYTKEDLTGESRKVAKIW